MDKDRKHILDKEIEVVNLQLEVNRMINDTARIANETQKVRLQGYELLYKFGRALIILIVINILLWTDTVSNSEFLQWLKSILHIQ